MDRENEGADLKPLEARPIDGPLLRDLAASCLRLGATAFGGPAAHVAMMRSEFVERRRWMSERDYLDLVAAASLLPGPSSSEVALFVGHRVAGLRGLLVAGACFIGPAGVVVAAIAFLYGRTQGAPAALSAMAAVKPAIVAIVAHACVGFARGALKSWPARAAAFAVGASAFGGADPAGATVAAGLVFACAGLLTQRGGWAAGGERAGAWVPLAVLQAEASGESAAAASSAATASTAGLATAAAAATASAATPQGLFLYFLKVGAFQFGSGYALLAFLQQDLVKERGWLTQAQLLDAVAVGQATPGPVFTAATFVGFALAGPLGAAGATVGVFAPAFAFVSLGSGLIARARRSKPFGLFLDGANAASVGLMAWSLVVLSREAVVDAPSAIVAAGGLAWTFVFNRGPTLLIALALAWGLARSFL